MCGILFRLRSVGCMRQITAFLVFFFQAEDGIRDYKVTGVQTCALPICLGAGFGRQVLGGVGLGAAGQAPVVEDRKSTRLNSSHLVISYAVFCLKKKILVDRLPSRLERLLRRLLSQIRQTPALRYPNAAR